MDTADTDTILSSARDHLIQPWESIRDLGEATRPVITGSDGIYVRDESGRALIDGPAGMWCSQLGYGRRDIADAMAAQAMDLSYTSPWYFTSSPAARLAQKISDVAPGDLNHVFFTCGGSTAVDSALRLVQLYQNTRGKSEKKIILARQSGYHGSTHLAASVSGNKDNRKNFDVDREPVSFLSDPHRLKFTDFETDEAFCAFLLNELRSRIDELGAERIAAYIGEPVQASGGVIVPPAGYLKGLRDICRDNDILYISDEVVTAFGRCGAWFASEDVFGITPDIITFAKGVTSGYVPLGGIVVSDAILNGIKRASNDQAVYSNGYTYSGHPVSCAAGLRVMEAFEEEGLLEHVRDVAPYFGEKLRELSSLDIVCDVRTAGLIGAVECGLPDSDDTSFGKVIDRHCLELGLIVRPIGNICVMSPPLIITREQIDELVSILKQGIESAAAEHRPSNR